MANMKSWTPLEGYFLARRGESFKYHMAKWEDIALPKEFGGMGIINTRRMNDYLMNKWI
jgi:hypothetical protein